MGQVYKARDTRLGRTVAIKIANRRFSERFEREARAISALNHPHICMLYDVGPNYLVMEVVEGETLAAFLRKGPVSIDLAMNYASQIAAARAPLPNAYLRLKVEKDGWDPAEFAAHPMALNGQNIPLYRAGRIPPGMVSVLAQSPWADMGAFPKDKGEFPVSGVSWFEASAYCAYAGKSLPTVHHWRKAAGFGIFSDILALSNFAGAGPARTGANPGISAFGAYDMAGNVREWCQNEAGRLRAILGGGWNEPSYSYRDPDAQDPFSRAPQNGLRCAV